MVTLQEHSKVSHTAGWQCGFSWWGGIGAEGVTCQYRGRSDGSVLYLLLSSVLSFKLQYGCFLFCAGKINGTDVRSPIVGPRLSLVKGDESFFPPRRLLAASWHLQDMAVTILGNSGLGCPSNLKTFLWVSGLSYELIVSTLSSGSLVGLSG